MSSPLEGYRVLDWTVWQQGPVASMMLGDLGAEVIKIEQKGMGDPARAMMKMSGAALGLSGRNAYFENNNRNKKSLALDLKNAGLSQIIITEIGSDGMLTGPKLDTIIRIAQKSRLDIIASGGIRSIEDLQVVAENACHGIRGIIIGRAIYENNLSVREAILQYQKEYDWKW